MQIVKIFIARGEAIQGSKDSMMSCSTIMVFEDLSVPKDPRLS
jgi:hypothetical protein